MNQIRPEQSVMRNIKVKIPSTIPGSYDITIAAGLLASVWNSVQKVCEDRNFFIVTDSNLLAAGHLETLKGGRDIPAYIIDPPGELSKTIQTVTAIIEAMEAGALGRDSCVVALGGGTVGDIAGFAAAIFKRGVPVIHIPTTTVSQADSSVGGKTGVDSVLSKNACGAFWHPAGVFIDVETLRTLRGREFNAGLVESIKHAMIADAEYFEFLQNNIELILRRKTTVLEQVAVKNCSIKAAIVEQDPTEKNKRSVLNYGHTIGHAVESASGFKLLHGEAVAIGILAACGIQRQLGLAGQELTKEAKALFEKLLLPLRIPAEISKSKIIDILRHDKKTVNAEPMFVLLEKCGKVHSVNEKWTQPVSAAMVENTIDTLY